MQKAVVSQPRFFSTSLFLNLTVSQPPRFFPTSLFPPPSEGVPRWNTTWGHNGTQLGEYTRDTMEHNLGTTEIDV